MPLPWGGVVSVSTMVDLGQSRDVMVSPRDLPRPTPVSGLVYDILWFYDIKNLCVLCFQGVYVLLKGILVVYNIVLPWHCQRRFRPARDIFKRKLLSID